MRTETLTFIDTNIAIMDGTSKSQLIAAIANYEEEMKETVLKAFISRNHILVMDTYDGSGIAQWIISDVQKFLTDKTFNKDTFKLNRTL